MNDDLHSRSRLAGYDPAVLQQARVALVGLGALGQNAGQNLALSGIGALFLVDHDVFEPHNRTRSPMYPSPAQMRRLGPKKAPNVAATARRISTARRPDYKAIPEPVQIAGNAVIAASDVVVSAVDSMNARAWLAEQCRQLGRPMIEGGFSGAAFNMSLFSALSGEVCYRCHDPGRVSAGSCAQYARVAEAQSIVPAIQTTAAVLGGLMAEATVQLLHGRFDPGTRFYGNVRTMTLSRAVLPPAPDCPGRHEPLPDGGEVHPPSPTLGALRDALAGRGFAQLAFADRIIEVELCTECRRPCRVLATETAWLLAHTCMDCGGPWPLSEPEASPGARRSISLTGHLPHELAALGLRELGLGPGAQIEVQDRDRMVLVGVSVPPRRPGDHPAS